MLEDSEFGILISAEIGTPLVDCTDSGANGFYELELEPGTYSIFAAASGGWFCNSSDTDGVCTITVDSGAATFYTIAINHLASF